MRKRWLITMVSVAVSIGVFCGGLIPGYTALAASNSATLAAPGVTATEVTSAEMRPVGVTSGAPTAQSHTAQAAQTAGSQSKSQPQGYARGFHSFSRRSTRRSYSYGGYGGSRYTGSRIGYGGFGSHLFSFGAGYLFGSLFHPFGGYYGYGGMYGYHHFSLLGVLFDLVILYIIWRIIRAFFRRR